MFRVISYTDRGKVTRSTASVVHITAAQRVLKDELDLTRRVMFGLGRDTAGYEQALIAADDAIIGDRVTYCGVHHEIEVV